MAKQEQLQFFCILKEEKMDFEILVEKIFSEFIQENENKSKSSNTRYIGSLKNYN